MDNASGRVHGQNSSRVGTSVVNATVSTRLVRSATSLILHTCQTIYPTVATAPRSYLWWSAARIVLDRRVGVGCDKAGKLKSKKTVVNAAVARG